MTVTKSAVAALVLVFAAGISGAMAKDAKVATTAKVHSPESIECSKQADAKGLHGDERKKFRSQCKKDMMAAKTTTAKKPDTKPADKTDAKAADKKS